MKELMCDIVSSKGQICIKQFNLNRINKKLRHVQCSHCYEVSSSILIALCLMKHLLRHIVYAQREMNCLSFPPPSCVDFGWK